MEKSQILDIINDWNYWDKKVPKFIEREKYQNLIEQYSKSGEVIVLKGIRRSGKSTLLTNHIYNLTKQRVKPTEILFINFEDPRFGEITPQITQQIIETYQEHINDKTNPYIFLDEIQNVPQWEKWVRTIHDLKKGQIFITGSSSKLLSKEFGTALSGRFLDISVFPLDFKEYLTFKGREVPDKTTLITKKIAIKKLFNSYMKEGGFPKIVLVDEVLKKKELLTYYDTIILKDIVARYNLKNQDNVKKVALYLLSNIGTPLNLNKIRTTLNLSYELVEKYFEYLKDTYLIFEINKFDYSLRKQFANRRKVYCIDNGILQNVSFKFSENYQRYLENVVFLELKRKNIEVFFHVGNKECDFVIKEGMRIIQALQVTKSLDNTDTRKREIEGLIEAIETYNLKEGLILTENEEDSFNVKGKKIVVKPIWKWLIDS